MYNRRRVESQSQESTQKMYPRMPCQVRLQASLNDQRQTIKLPNQEYLPKNGNRSSQDYFSNKEIGQNNSNNPQLMSSEEQSRTRLKFPRSSHEYRIDFPYIRQVWQGQRQPIREKTSTSQNAAINLSEYNEFTKKRKYYYMKFHPHLTPLQVKNRTRDDYEKMTTKLGKNEKNTREKEEIKKEIKKEEESGDIMQQSQWKENLVILENTMEMRVGGRMNNRKKEQRI